MAYVITYAQTADEDGSFACYALEVYMSSVGAYSRSLFMGTDELSSSYIEDEYDGDDEIVESNLEQIESQENIESELEGSIPSPIISPPSPSKKRPFKERKITLIDSSPDNVHISISGNPIAYKTKGIEHALRSIRKLVTDVFKQNDLKRFKGMLKAEIEFLIEPRQVSIISPQSPTNSPQSPIAVGRALQEGMFFSREDDILSLSQFALEILRGCSHRETGAIIELKVTKKVSKPNEPETRIFIEKFNGQGKGGTVPVENRPDAYSSQINASCPCEFQNLDSGKKADFIVHEAPDSYHEKFQWLEREAYGHLVRRAIQKKDDSEQFTRLSGPVEGEITFFLPTPKGIKERAESAYKRNEVLLHSKQPSLDRLGLYVLYALQSVILKSPEQVSSLILKKAYSPMPKTVIRLQQIETNVEMDSAVEALSDQMKETKL